MTREQAPGCEGTSLPPPAAAHASWISDPLLFAPPAGLAQAHSATAPGIVLGSVETVAVEQTAGGLRVVAGHLDTKSYSPSAPSTASCRGLDALPEPLPALLDQNGVLSQLVLAPGRSPAAERFSPCGDGGDSSNGLRQEPLVPPRLPSNAALAPTPPGPAVGGDAGNCAGGASPAEFGSSAMEFWRLRELSALARQPSSEAQTAPAFAMPNSAIGMAGGLAQFVAQAQAQAPCTHWAQQTARAASLSVSASASASAPVSARSSSCLRSTEALSTKRWIFNVFKFALCEAQLHRSAQRLEWNHALAVTALEGKRTQHAAIIAELKEAHAAQVARLEDEHAATLKRLSSTHSVAMSELQTRLRQAEQQRDSQIAQLRFQHGAELSASELHTARLEEEMLLQMQRTKREQDVLDKGWTASLLTRSRCAAGALGSGRDALLLSLAFGAFRRLCEASRTQRQWEGHAAAERMLLEQMCERRMRQLEQSSAEAFQARERSLAQEAASWQASALRAEQAYAEASVRLRRLEEGRGSLRMRALSTATSSVKLQDTCAITVSFLAWQSFRSTSRREREVARQSQLDQEQIQKSWQDKLSQVHSESSSKLQVLEARLQSLQSEWELKYEETMAGRRRAEQEAAQWMARCGAERGKLVEAAVRSLVSRADSVTLAASFSAWRDDWRALAVDRGLQQQLSLAEKRRAEDQAQTEKRLQRVRRAHDDAMRKLASDALRQFLSVHFAAWCECISASKMEEALQAQARRTAELQQEEALRSRHLSMRRLEGHRGAVRRLARDCDELLCNMAFRAWRGDRGTQRRRFMQLETMAATVHRDRRLALLGYMYSAWSLHAKLNSMESSQQRQLHVVEEGKQAVVSEMQARIAQMERERAEAVRLRTAKASLALCGTKDLMALLVVFCAWHHQQRASHQEKAWQELFLSKEQGFREEISQVERRVVELEGASGEARWERGRSVAAALTAAKRQALLLVAFDAWACLRDLSRQEKRWQQQRRQSDESHALQMLESQALVVQLREERAAVEQAHQARITSVLSSRCSRALFSAVLVAWAHAVERGSWERSRQKQLLDLEEEHAARMTAVEAQVAASHRSHVERADRRAAAAIRAVFLGRQRQLESVAFSAWCHACSHSRLEVAWQQQLQQAEKSQLEKLSQIEAHMNQIEQGRVQSVKRSSSTAVNAIVCARDVHCVMSAFCGWYRAWAYACSENAFKKQVRDITENHEEERGRSDALMLQLQQRFAHEVSRRATQTAATAAQSRLMIHLCMVTSMWARAAHGARVERRLAQERAQLENDTAEAERGLRMVLAPVTAKLRHCSHRYAAATLTFSLIRCLQLSFSAWASFLAGTRRERELALRMSFVELEESCKRTNQALEELAEAKVAATRLELTEHLDACFQLASARGFMAAAFLERCRVRGALALAVSTWARFGKQEANSRLLESQLQQAKRDYEHAELQWANSKEQRRLHHTDAMVAVLGLSFAKALSGKAFDMWVRARMCGRLQATMARLCEEKEEMEAALQQAEDSRGEAGERLRCRTHRLQRSIECFCVFEEERQRQSNLLFVLSCWVSVHRARRGELAVASAKASMERDSHQTSASLHQLLEDCETRFRESDALCRRFEQDRVLRGQLWTLRVGQFIARDTAVQLRAFAFLCWARSHLEHAAIVKLQSATGQHVDVIMKLRAEVQSWWARTARACATHYVASSRLCLAKALSHWKHQRSLAACDGRQEEMARALARAQHAHLRAAYCAVNNSFSRHVLVCLYAWRTSLTFFNYERGLCRRHGQLEGLASSYDWTYNSVALHRALLLWDLEAKRHQQEFSGSRHVRHVAVSVASRILESADSLKTVFMAWHLRSLTALASRLTGALEVSHAGAATVQTWVRSTHYAMASRVDRRRNVLLKRVVFMHFVQNGLMTRRERDALQDGWKVRLFRTRTCEHGSKLVQRQLGVQSRCAKHTMLACWRLCCRGEHAAQSLHDLHTAFVTLKGRAANSMRKTHFSIMAEALACWRQAVLACRSDRERERLKQWQRQLTQEKEERKMLHQTLWLKGYLTKWRQLAVNVRHAREIETMKRAQGSGNSMWSSYRAMGVLAAIEEQHRDVLLYESFMRWVVVVVRAAASRAVSPPHIPSMGAMSTAPLVHWGPPHQFVTYTSQLRATATHHFAPPFRQSGGTITTTYTACSLPGSQASLPTAQTWSTPLPAYQPAVSPRRQLPQQQPPLQQQPQLCAAPPSQPVTVPPLALHRAVGRPPLSARDVSPRSASAEPPLTYWGGTTCYSARSMDRSRRAAYYPGQLSGAAAARSAPLALPTAPLPGRAPTACQPGPRTVAAEGCSAALGPVEGAFSRGQSPEVPHRSVPSMWDPLVDAVISAVAPFTGSAGNHHVTFGPQSPASSSARHFSPPGRQRTLSPSDGGPLPSLWSQTEVKAPPPYS